jgi:hypothetical protein
MSQEETTKYSDSQAPVPSAQVARQAKPLGDIRYMLIFSVGMAIIAGVVIWLLLFG